MGNRPQARPSLRLLTRPAWLAEESAGSRKLVWREHLAVAQLAVQVVVLAVGAGDVAGGLEAGVVSGLLDGQCGEAQAEGGEGDAEEERGRAQPVGLGEVAGRQSGGGDGGVSGGLVEAHRQAAPGRADEVDLHHHGGRPGQPLADAEQDVGEDDPAPGRRPDQQQRDRDGDEPAGDQDRFAAEPVGPGSGEVVGGGLGQAEDEDEGQPGGVRLEAELALPQQGQDGALLAEHAADEGVDRDEQGELGGVLPQPEPDGANVLIHQCSLRGFLHQRRIQHSID